MNAKNEINLVAIIEEYNNSEIESIFKITNFSPNKTIENVSLEKNIQGKHELKYTHSDIFQIPYAKNLKNLSVIVGENGSGKTTIINNILSRSNRNNCTIHLIFEKNNELWIYPKLGKERFSIKQDSTRPYIIKFSNANELRNSYLTTRQGAIDASNYKNILEFDGNISENDVITDLKETINQIKFVDEFKNDISKFVNYTQKGVSVRFESDRLPLRSKQLLYLDEIEKAKLSTNKNEYEKYAINFRLLEFFSLLINHTIDIDYPNDDSLINYEKLLDLHLALRKDNKNIQLQYQSIGVDSDRFLPDEYSIVGLHDDVPEMQLDDSNIEDWIKIWHEIYIINLYFNNINKTDKNKNKKNKYNKEIKKIIESLKEKNTELKTIKKFSEKDLTKLDEYINKIEKTYNNFYNVLFVELSPHAPTIKEWESVWQKTQIPCTRVAKAISYTSFFELSEKGYFVNHKLIPERVWTKLTEINISNDEIKRLKVIEKNLYDIQEVNTDFTILSTIVKNLSEISISKLEKSIQFKWIGLSSGELGLLKSFANLYSAKKVLQSRSYHGINEENFLLLLDEIDLGLHPEWQRKWVSTALPIIEKIFDNNHLQIIITTHSPILLSDIYKENIIFLSKDSTESENSHFKKTFGQNIYTLYKNSFFLNKPMGEYANKAIEDTLEYLHHKINPDLKNNQTKSIFYGLNDGLQKNMALKIIKSIGEPIIANQLRELYDKAFSQSKIEKIKAEITKLQEQLQELEEDNSK